MNDKFVGEIRHPFDIKRQKKLARRMDALLNAKIVDRSGNVIGTIHYADGNTLFEITAGSGSINAQFRGEYYSGATYSVGDMVTVASGVNSGTYICVKANPTASNLPWIGGGYWIKLPSSNALGQWM